MNILAFTQPGTNSRGVYRDILEGLEELGHRLFRFELSPYWEAMRALGPQRDAATDGFGGMFLELVNGNEIDLSLSMWGHATKTMPSYDLPDGSRRAIFDAHGHRMLHYWWDAPHWFEEGQELDNVLSGLYRGTHQLHLINNPATGSEMAELMGFRNVIPSPNGVNPGLFRPRPEIRPDYDLVFVSGAGDPQPTPVMLEEMERDDPDVERIRRDIAGALGPALERIVAARVEGAQRAPVRRLLDAMVEARLADRHAPALVHLKQAVAAHPDLAAGAEKLLGDVRLYVEATDAIRRIEKWERPFLVAYLSRHFKCLRMGQQRYDAWGVTGDASGYVEYDRQSEIYARGRVALNVMRWQDDVGLNSKVFEITACGAACLQMHRGGVETLFEPGREILVAQTPGEARALLADLLRDPGRREDLAAAGRARTLAEHTWARRLATVLRLVEMDPAAPEAPPRARTPARGVSPTGARLAFVLAPMRSGSTLLRRMLDAHPQLASPPETWFLLPLLNLWEGAGEHLDYNPRQAAAALQSVATRETFIESCRDFAAAVYSPLLPPGGACVVDKTPFYLKIAEVLPDLFPEARFIVLARDPRATAWSLFTWEKAAHESLEAPIRATAAYLRKQHAFCVDHPDRTLIVHYEQLCRRPEAASRALCAFLGAEYDPAMIEYGSGGDGRPGYGDEKSLLHGRPHTESLRRWAPRPDGGGMSPDDQRLLARGCGAEALALFGYRRLAALLEGACTPRGRRPATA